MNKRIKKMIAVGATMLMGSTMLFGCSTEKKVTKNEDGTTKISELKIAFSPYADADSITTATKPLEELLKSKLKDHGYEVDKITMSVGTSYEAVGESLSAGSADVGFISGATYVLYEDNADVLLTALRHATNKDSTEAKDWNDGTVEKQLDEESTYYRSIFLAGPSKKGQELLKKVNSGEKLTWEDLNSAKWAVMSPASASGYIYPSMYLKENYGHTINDLANKVQSDSYSTSLARLASGQVDIMVSYGHIRIKNAEKWEKEYGGTDAIEKQSGVIAVTDKIFNDTVSISKKSKLMDDGFKKALSDSLIEIGNTKEGEEILSVFSMTGFQEGDSSNYDGERKAQKELQEN